MNEKIKDFTIAIKEDATTAFVESDCLVEAVSRLTDLITTPEISSLVGSIFGMAAPRINGVFLAYKQNRFERNITKMVEALSDQVTALETHFLGLSKEMQEKFQSLYAEMLLDNIVDERQEEKIAWNVNGFITMMNNEANDNIMQLFFDTLAELTILDVDVLKMQDTLSDLDFTDVQQKYGIDFEQLKLVREKLVRLGLMVRKNDEVRDTNIDEITEYLQKVEKDSSKSKPKGVKFPSKIKKVRNTESYRLSSMGRNFLKGIGEIR